MLPFPQAKLQAQGPWLVFNSSHSNYSSRVMCEPILNNSALGMEFFTSHPGSTLGESPIGSNAMGRKGNRRLFARVSLATAMKSLGVAGPDRTWLGPGEVVIRTSSSWRSSNRSTGESCGRSQ